MNENLLKSKRVLKGFTQKDLAKDLGMSEKTFNHKERGKIVFKPIEIVRVSNILKLSISEVNEIFFNNDLPIV